MNKTQIEKKRINNCNDKPKCCSHDNCNDKEKCCSHNAQEEIFMIDVESLITGERAKMCQKCISKLCEEGDIFEIL